MLKIESGQWESTWEVAFPARTGEELLTALVVRDLLHGASFDLELEPTGPVVSVDYEAGDELEGDAYRLLVTARVSGVEDRAAVQELTEHVLEQLLEEGVELVARRDLLATIPMSDVVFEVVDESEERWDLVVPDWLAPDGAEVPFGFRPMADSEPLPSDEQLDGHGRVVLVPHGDTAFLFGIPAPVDDDNGGELPVIQ
jgi:hypothetical protein